MRRSKTKQFLEGNRIIAVRNEPRSLVLVLDNGHVFRVVAGIAEFDHACLDFHFDPEDREEDMEEEEDGEEE